METVATIKRNHWREGIQDALNELDMRIQTHYPKTTWDYVAIGDVSSIETFKPTKLHNIKYSGGFYQKMPKEENGRILVMPRSYSGLLPVMDENGLLILDSNKLPVLVHQERVVAWFIKSSAQPFAEPQFRLSTPEYAYLLKLED